MPGTEGNLKSSKEHLVSSEQTWQHRGDLKGYRPSRQEAEVDVGTNLNTELSFLKAGTLEGLSPLKMVHKTPCMCLQGFFLLL